MHPDDDRVVLDRIEDWRRRLIDLSYRNRLIRYKPTRATTLEIESPDLDVLLADRDRTAPWRFFFPPEPEEESAGEEEDAASFVDSVVVTGAQRIDRSPRPDEIVVTESHPRQINRILENLARKSNAEFQDKALRILYIATGFLDWKDPTRDEQLSSPLILVPVELRRESAKHPYALYFVDDEEPVVNPSLTEKLRRDLGRDIPRDWAFEDKPVMDELSEIEAAVAGTGWSVRSDAVLGLFSFQKFVMYRDLLDNEEQISRHPIIRSFALKQLSEDVSGESVKVPPPAELDEAQPTHTDLLVLDADATQRRAIEAAKRGQSFVMHGPPGTGKSQTIANVIAELIGAGKRVLFVSEKAAALDVVHRRLKAAGLDEYCLMLHGEHAARREVVESLHRSLTSEIVPRTGMKTDELSRLSDLRDLLNSSADLRWNVSSSF
jgi:Cdc6-like AAA superfamily ATPase